MEKKGIHVQVLFEEVFVHDSLSAEVVAYNLHAEELLIELIRVVIVLCYNINHKVLKRCDVELWLGSFNDGESPHGVDKDIGDDAVTFRQTVEVVGHGGG